MQAVAPSTAEMFERIEARERVRTLRMQRHLVFATSAALSLVVLSQLADTVVELALFPVFIGILVRSVARGADAKFGHLWGWVYTEPTSMTTLDRVVARVVEAARPLLMTSEEVGELDVRPLDPFDD